MVFAEVLDLTNSASILYLVKEQHDFLKRWSTTTNQLDFTSGHIPPGSFAIPLCRFSMQSHTKDLLEIRICGGHSSLNICHTY